MALFHAQDYLRSPKSGLPRLTSSCNENLRSLVFKYSSNDFLPRSNLTLKGKINNKLYRFVVGNRSLKVLKCTQKGTKGCHNWPT